MKYFYTGTTECTLLTTTTYVRWKESTYLRITGVFMTHDFRFSTVLLFNQKLE